MYTAFEKLHSKNYIYLIPRENLQFYISKYSANSQA